MNIYKDLINRTEKMSVIGLGYVGMPIAVTFAKKVDIIGFDLNKEKINLYRNGIDPTNEVGNEAIKNSTIEFTNDEEKLKNSLFHIVAVPTPIKIDKSPDLTPVESASEIIGRNLRKGAIVVFESTVYPGVTEDVCIPILEKHSGLICGKDFMVGYSPERINPGDKKFTLENIVKIVSGIDEDSRDEIAKVYEIVISAGVHKANSIKVAEAAKVAENTQRDINIAFMNELSMVFNKMDINTNEVIDAMKTKWNSLNFYPGLVGGHCIGVDPYYFLYEAEKLGYHSQIISGGRKINDGMSKFVVESIIKELVLMNKKVKESKIAILGLTFKENVPDIRNSKVVDLINHFKEYEIVPEVVDSVADSQEVEGLLNINLKDFNTINTPDCLIIAVNHSEFKDIKVKDLMNIFKTNSIKENNEKLVIDIKGMFNEQDITDAGFKYWTL